jgi:hypothetical protein
MASSSRGERKPRLTRAGLRIFIYSHFVRTGRAPLLAEMAKGLRRTLPEIKRALPELCATHAFVQQENGELWRAAPFSAVPTGFTVEAGKRSWWGNCIWDALGILAALHKDGRILASCGCCNLDMILHVRGGKLVEREGLIHIAVPACEWYQDIVFT